MINLNNKDLPLPAQTEGAQKDIWDSVTMPTKEEVYALYKEAKSRLQDVNNWGELCGGTSASFDLTDSEGQRITGRPQVGFHFRIDIPGPGASSGRGYDWVQVEQVYEEGNNTTETEYILIRIRPATDPTTSTKDVAHFFSDKSTSNFLLLREGVEVIAAVLGRNEVANIEESHNLLDKIRNFFIGTSAKAGMADPQWKSLVQGILGKND